VKRASSLAHDWKATTSGEIAGDALREDMPDRPPLTIELKPQPALYDKVVRAMPWVASLRRNMGCGLAKLGDGMRVSL
jgi:hypothetical protein